MLVYLVAAYSWVCTNYSSFSDDCGTALKFSHLIDVEQVLVVLMIIIGRVDSLLLGR